MMRDSLTAEYGPHKPGVRVRFSFPLFIRVWESGIPLVLDSRERSFDPSHPDFGVHERV